MLSPHQAKYFAYELTKRCPSESVEKFSATLLDAQVDLNPHQVDAALFAFKSPLSNGAILADEVGLGKTIEASILLSQKWAEGNRKLIVICPSNLRKQWSQELEEKFFLPSQILESKSFKGFIKNGKKNPFEQPKVVICSFHFARSKAEFLQLVSWDLVTIDEAHRLRNVYKPSNVIGRTIKNAIIGCRKVLLTATPLQNSLMELFGLVSFIDDHVFGDRLSFRTQFTRLGGDVNFQDLRDRIAPVCHRTLRRQVQEYIRYTNRTPATIRFEPSEEEQRLYELVNAYLQRDFLFALPGGQRHLLTMIMRKLLASSTFAIAGTLNKLVDRLEKMVTDGEAQLETLEEFEEDLEDLEDYLDEWEYEEVEEETQITEEEIERIKTEIDELKGYRDLAESIENNTKGEKLIIALREGLSKMKELKAPQKAIIFTESRRTQNYLFNLLEQTEFKDKIVLFNGANSDDKSKEIYTAWRERFQDTDRSTDSRSADIRAALVEYFRDEAQIMIATEAAAEGINLQFCAMVVNYDLPWNPQRIEQRIGRCHRYGQLHDVVVVNFINLRNAADQRVFQLLDQKFQLFSGVFGASDEVLGTIESGVDFERKITAIYQNCRTTEEINRSFDNLQKELEEQIETRMKSAREQLFEHFDAEVIDKLKVRMEDAQSYIGRYEQWLWKIALYALALYANFDRLRFMFELKQLPPKVSAPLGWYTLDKKQEALHRLRIGHPLAQAIIQQAKGGSTPPVQLTFNYTNILNTVSILEPLVGKSGYLQLSNLVVHALDTTDNFIFIAATEEGERLTDEQCRRLLNLDIIHSEPLKLEVSSEEVLEQEYQEAKKTLLQELQNRDTAYFKTENIKLQKWADDRIFAAEKAIRDSKSKIRELERQVSTENEMQALLDIQMKIKELKQKQRRQRTEIFAVEDEIESQRDAMIGEIEVRMQQKIVEEPLFTIKWRLS